MQTKLTLRLEERLIGQAKRYARQEGKSVSQLVGDYFALLGRGEEAEHEGGTPMVRSLRGSLGQRGDFRGRLRRKHL